MVVIDLFAVVGVSVLLPAIDLLPDVVSKAVDVDRRNIGFTAVHCHGVAALDVGREMHVDDFGCACGEIHAASAQRGNDQDGGSQGFVRGARCRQRIQIGLAHALLVTRLVALGAVLEALLRTGASCAVTGKALASAKGRVLPRLQWPS